MESNALKVIQSDIKKKGFDWIAGETSVTKLSEKEQEGLLGLHITKEELKATEQLIKASDEFQKVRAPLSLPSSVDWRNKGGDWTSPIKDQKGCGSCVAFGTIATIESRLNIACKNPSFDKDLSEAYLFYCGCGNCCGTGWNFAPALDFCKNTGVALESSLPYTPHDQACPSSVSKYMNITAWNQVLSIQDRKNIIATKGPVLGGMAVYSDFSAYKHGVYRKTAGSTLSGYHAISIVGYDDNQECWICKNSWGTGWGDNGWFKIGYGECLIDTSFAFYDIDVKCKEDCKKYADQAIKYRELYNKTKKVIYLCYFYRYAAYYYLCKYRLTHDRRYYCYYLKYMNKYYECMYKINCTK